MRPRATEEQGLKLAVYCTGPAIRNVGANLVTEFIGTFALVFGVYAIFTVGGTAGDLSAGLGPLLVGFLVWGIGLSLGGPTGYAINPARDLGPRILGAYGQLAGKSAPLDGMITEMTLFAPAVSIYGGSDATTVSEVVARVRAAADEGFPAFWLPQTAGLDALTALAVAAREVPSIGLGTAVVPVQGRHPIPLAQQALTLSDAAGEGRVTLGIGVTHKPVSEGWYGIPYSSVVRSGDVKYAASDLIVNHRSGHATSPPYTRMAG